jgi:hypothetical protein
MSYEGYEQFMCKNGHLDEHDCYLAPNTKYWKCPTCKENCAWWNSVDQTNELDEETGIYPGEIGLELAEDQNSPVTECPTCKHNTYSEPVYKVPEKGRRS